MIEPVLFTIGSFLAATWWIWAFLILSPLFGSTWLFWRQELYKAKTEYILLELRMPLETHHSPRGMEQVLGTIHALRNTANDLEEKWWDGEITRWFALEMTSFGGEVHLYIRTYYKYRALVEAAFFSYYPDIEIVEVEDYVSRFPNTVREMYAQNYDMWGAEMELLRESAYPIKTYLDFESPDEEKQYDPISAFIEILAKLKPEEMVGIQFLIQPALDDWHEKWDKQVVSKLKESSKGIEGGSATKKKTATRTWDFSSGPLPVLSVAGNEKREESPFRAFMRTPGETEALKAVEENLAKPAFQTLIRFLYFSPKALFYDSYPRRGIRAAFNQYSAQDLNGFAINYAVGTRVRIWNKPHIFPNVRVEYRKQRLMHNYRKREMPPDTFMGKLITSTPFNWNFASKEFELTTRSLASLFHPPTAMVLTAPHIKRVESRKTGPPAGLAIFGEEREIERFR